ncbi:hypothetical protein [Bacteroides sp. UBA939]|uniref:hypothetical protein n=1 Tax=Bacteroides sp. UBA939 TaxID=1946092 RepID=UPI0025B8E4E2|nr:hypothetical protein [Bacteroides sp. UBA939]
MNILKVIAFIELVLGLFLLLREVDDYIRLPTTQEVDEKFGGIVDLFKYKESCYKNFFLYSLLTTAGLSFWINRKLHWGLTQMLLMTLWFVVIMELWFMRLSNWGVSSFLGILSLSIFIYLEIKIWNSSFAGIMKISKTAQWLFLVGGLISCSIWGLLYL